MKYFAALFMLISIACSNNKNISKATTSINERDSISLTRTGCFGTCPIYELSIKANGEVKYNGKAYVENIGSFEGNIKSTKTLFQNISNLNWKSYPDKYPIDNVDFPQWQLTYNSSKLTKEVKCNSNAAEELKALALVLDELVKKIELNEVID